jgi:hypothetical protein
MLGYRQSKEHNLGILLVSNTSLMFHSNESFYIFMLWYLSYVKLHIIVIGSWCAPGYIPVCTHVKCLSYFLFSTFG